MLGSAIFVSSAILHVRKNAFEKQLEALAERKRKRQLRPRVLTFSLSRRAPSAGGRREDAVASGAVRGQAIKDPLPDSEYNFSPQADGRPFAHDDDDSPSPALATGISGTEAVVEGDAGHIRFNSDAHEVQKPANAPAVLRRTHTRLFDGSGVGAHGLINHPKNAQPVLYPENEGRLSLRYDTSKRGGPALGLDKHLQTVNGYIGRNSQFHHLSEKERRKLGGIEYDAICFLSWIVPIYFVLWQLLGVMGMGAWLKNNRSSTAETNGKLPGVVVLFLLTCGQDSMPFGRVLSSLLAPSTIPVWLCWMQTRWPYRQATIPC